MAAAADHSHRAGKLKQNNKKNKRATGSKRSRKNLQGGKIQSLPSAAGHRKGPKQQSNDGVGRSEARANRMNNIKQRREASRKTVWNARRGIVAGTASKSELAADVSLSRSLSTAPPRIVGIISLSEVEGALEERVRTSLMGGADKKVLSTSSNDEDALLSTVTAAFNTHAKGNGSQYITILTNTSSFRPQYSSTYEEEDASVQAALDLCRVCDLVLFLIDGSTATIVTTAGGGSMSDAHSIANISVKTGNTTAHLDHLISERGDRILSAVKSQGMPTPVTVIVHKEEEGGDDDSPLGRSVGLSGDAALLDAMKDDSEDDDSGMEEDTFTMPMSFANKSTTTQRSMKSIRRSYLRKRSELKRYIARLAATEFGVEAGSKVVELDLLGKEEDCLGTMDEESVAASVATTATASGATVAKTQTSIAALIRMLCTIAASPPSWVADVPRPYLVTDGCAANSASAQYDESSRELKLTGYIRGNTPWNTNQLVHVPHLGTYAIKHVMLAGDVCSGGSDDKQLLLPPILAAARKPQRRKATKTAADTDMADGAISKDVSGGVTAVVLAKSDPEERESLEMFASPDALEGEQNLIGFDDGFDEDDDLNDDQDNNLPKKPDKFQPGTSRPAGWSDYQSAWLDALGEEGEGEAAEDRGELAFALNGPKKTDATDTLMDEDDQVNAEEKRALLAQRKQLNEDNLKFPDEVDHEEETSAADRFARYRAIKNFRKSYWDPKENLPDTYGAVYHFSSFKATQRDVLGDVRGLEELVGRRGWGANVGKGEDVDNMDQDSDDEEEEAMARACVPPGAYVTITLQGIPSSAYANLSPHTILTAVSLLPHENKVSVLHMGLTSQPNSKTDNDIKEVPIKSKDVLTFRCGWRTWSSRPIFSQHNLNSDKHKFERYMPTNGGAFFAGSVFGPVTYGNCPVLMFREAKDVTMETPDIVIGDAVGGGRIGDSRREFLAHGSIIGADADRIVLKRIVLTGFPTRVHKRHATVKYMFYNPEDVKWFMPAGITTKHGLQGNIIQSVGDHGVMKCLFDRPIKQHDTVCLPLYKRVFPKFAPMIGNEEGSEVGSEGGGGGSGKHFQVL